MTASIEPLTSRPAWKALAAHHQKIGELHLRTLFAEDPGRGQRMIAEDLGFLLDYSKNRITDETLKLLFQPGHGVSVRHHKSPGAVLFANHGLQFPWGLP